MPMLKGLGDKYMLRLTSTRKGCCGSALAKGSRRPKNRLVPTGRENFHYFLLAAANV